MARILLVDDDELVLKLLSEFFASAHHETVLAHNGVDGLRIAGAERPDLVVLDVEMLGLSGYEVCARLRRDPKTRRLPILMLTGRTELPDAMRGLGSGADDYLTKPFQLDELGARAGALLKLASGG